MIMYTNKERWLNSLKFVHDELFMDYKGFWVGNKGTIYNSKKKLVKSDMFRVDGVQTRRNSFILDAWDAKTHNYKELRREYVDLSKRKKRENKKNGFRWYRRKVDELTNLQPLHVMKDIELRGFCEHNIDHIMPVKYCFENGISEKECSDISNLQVLTFDENSIKGQSMYCVIDQCDHLKNLVCE